MLLMSNKEWTSETEFPSASQPPKYVTYQNYFQFHFKCWKTLWGKKVFKCFTYRKIGWFSYFKSPKRDIPLRRLKRPTSKILKNFPKKITSFMHFYHITRDSELCFVLSAFTMVHYFFMSFHTCINVHIN